MATEAEALQTWGNGCRHVCSSCAPAQTYYWQCREARLEVTEENRKLVERNEMLVEENFHLRRQAMDLDATAKILEDLNRLAASLLKVDR